MVPSAPPEDLNLTHEQIDYIISFCRVGKDACNPRPTSSFVNQWRTYTHKNMPLGDGTPRSEKGYRVFRQWPLEVDDGKRNSVVYQSPLLKDEKSAKNWYPEVDFIAKHWGFAP